MEITGKPMMYRMLANGDFGNTIPQFFSVEEWRASPDFKKYKSWGVRTLRAGGPCRLHCPREDVAKTASQFAEPVNISMMIDVVTRVRLWADVMDPEVGLIVHGMIDPPRLGGWRALMPSQAKEYTGLKARQLLRDRLSASSLDDLYMLLERHPGHVVELSACASNIGTIPGRNAVIWEVRRY